MSGSIIFSMSAFALAASISPGPVNLVCLSSGIRYGLATTLVFVTGATLGFVLLFVSLGLGLKSIFLQWGELESALRWGGILFLLYMSVQLLRASGDVQTQSQTQPPGFMTGALMQWLNPKAWLAGISGIAAYTAGGDMYQVLLFALLYLPICWLSLGVWAAAGAWLQQRCTAGQGLRWLNRILALLLLMSCVLLLI
ncbi:LysE family translocator [Nitrincola iocasae]|nr:LysE family translocator [Nitrincola iocasae]